MTLVKTSDQIPWDNRNTGTVWTQDQDHQLGMLKLFHCLNMLKIFIFVLPMDGGLAGLSSPGGGRGCCGNMEAGIPPGNTGNTVGTGAV